MVVENTAQVVSLTVDQLLDNVYGDVTLPHDDIVATDCSLEVIPAGETYECTFTVELSAGDAGDVITDVSDGLDGDICDTDDAIVTYTDVVTVPHLTKTAVAAQVTVDVTFEVEIDNPSLVERADHPYYVQDDVFGDVTSVQGNVVSTTCGTGGVVLPGEIYTCSFVGRLHSTGQHVDVVSATAVDDDGVVFGAPELQDDALVDVSVVFP